MVIKMDADLDAHLDDFSPFLDNFDNEREEEEIRRGIPALNCVGRGQARALPDPRNVIVPDICYLNRRSSVKKIGKGRAQALRERSMRVKQDSRPGSSISNTDDFTVDTAGLLTRPRSGSGSNPLLPGLPGQYADAPHQSNIDNISQSTSVRSSLNSGLLSDDKSPPVQKVQPVKQGSGKCPEVESHSNNVPQVNNTRDSISRSFPAASTDNDSVPGREHDPIAPVGFGFGYGFGFGEHGPYPAGHNESVSMKTPARATLSDYVDALYSKDSSSLTSGQRKKRKKRGAAEGEKQTSALTESSSPAGTSSVNKYSSSGQVGTNNADEDGIPTLSWHPKVHTSTCDILNKTTSPHVQTSSIDRDTTSFSGAVSDSGETRPGGGGEEEGKSWMRSGKDVGVQNVVVVREIPSSDKQAFMDLLDMISQFGLVLQYKFVSKSDSHLAYFRMEDPGACKWLIDSVHESSGPFEGDVCLRVELL